MIAYLTGVDIYLQRLRDRRGRRGRRLPTSRRDDVDL